ncbi:hypothetical protein AB0393_07180 [Streptomyces cyaneofuscatus]
MDEVDPLQLAPRRLRCHHSGDGDGVGDQLRGDEKDVFLDGSGLPLGEGEPQEVTRGADG